MLEIIKERTREETIEYKLEFPINGSFNNGGYSFPCDSEGNLLTSKMPNKIGMIESYLICLNDPIKFGTGKISKYSNSYISPAIGKCRCGHAIELYDELYGACECPFCHQWYNMFGQELKPPKFWEEF